MSKEFKVSFIKYDPDIKSIASKFLDKYNSLLSIPVPIEEIAEFALKIDIIPIPGLRDVLGIEGFIASNLKELEVDDYIYNKWPTRYRFTIAHEIGHIIMHAGILKAGKIKVIDDYLRFMNEMPEEEYAKLEFQANAFAGLVLVPSKTLIYDVKQKLITVKKKLSENMREPDFIWTIIGEILAKKYEVSASVITIRIELEQIKKMYASYFD